MALVCPVYGMPCNCLYRCQPTKKPSHRHGSPRTERGETTGPKPSKTTTYILTCEFTLKDANYTFARSMIERAVKEIPFLTGLDIQIDYIAIEKQLPGVKDG